MISFAIKAASGLRRDDG